MRNIVGWLLIFIGGLIGVVPTMVLQVWNGASLIGLIIFSVGAYQVLKGQIVV